MNRQDLWKLIAVVGITLFSLYKLYPSYRYYTLSPAQRGALPAQELAKLRRDAIHLGLDLQGGMHLVLEFDSSHLNAAEAKDAPERAMEIIRNRVDQFGVAEPLIQREGKDRIAGAFCHGGRHVAVAEDEPREGGGRSPEERGGEDEPARIEAEAAGAIRARTRRLARLGDVREAGAGRASRSVQPSLCAG